jgi:molybdopterin synthase sulfur carrier subunit
MLTIHYFASIRESLERDNELIELPDSVSSVAELIAYLGAADPGFKSLVDGNNKVLVAVNQTVVDKSYTLSEDDEIAFFPPMTGG